MSLDGLEKLAPMGYIPKPPPQYSIRHTAPPISVADDATFDRWMMLPESDKRTLEEFAANPVVQEITWHYGPKPPVGPPPLPPSTPPAKTGNLRASLPEGPPNRLIIGGVQPDKPWPRK